MTGHNRNHMNKVVKFIIITVVAIYLGSQIFNYYNSTHILGNQAAFNIYLDIKESDIDSLFGLKKGTFDKTKQVIVCQLPVNPTGLKTKTVPVSFNVNNIDCNRDFDGRIDTKYSNAELDGNYFRLAIIRQGFPLILVDADLPIMKSTIIASKDITTSYRRGKINNIVISMDKVYNYCTKQ